MPLSDREYMRNPAKTRAEQRQRRTGFSIPPLLSRSRSAPPVREAPAKIPGRRVWTVYAAVVVSIGIIGAFVIVVVRELL